MADLVSPEDIPHGKGIVELSARTGEGVPELLKAIEEALGRGLHRVTLLLPYSAAAWVDTLHNKAKILRCEYLDRGIELETVCDDILYGKLKEYERK